MSGHAAAPGLFDPMVLRGLELSHRGWVAAMCQYSADAVNAPGVPNDWHLMHLGSFAAGGAALIITEATAVSPEGRISPQDTGLYTPEQVGAWRRITDFVHRHSAVDTKIGVQLAHAGRKASTYPPFAAGRGSVPVDDGGWQTVGPTAEAFGRYAAPAALDDAGILQVIADFAQAAERAVEAGFDTIEIHAAHGYLLHQFLTPLVNTRTDGWGGSEEARNRLTLEVIDAVRAVIPDSMPLLLRISATDWMPGGLDEHSSARLAAEAGRRGVDLVDVSTGGAVPAAAIPVAPGYQTGFAESIRADAGIPTAAVGLIRSAAEAEETLRGGRADAVLIGRAALSDPHWWLHAAEELDVKLPWAPQYERARPA
ncbi:NADH:flavin oxidoreductase/NADH oxidase [Arthrobacter jiangjiafuii]|uniref:NADH:flavin oxidoreductase/NADH oxidase n=1 Tax=Arthrobacter jiangjiafuii TaxID=2817475 RepID=A0A975M3A6_9MICC|nr:NADH:flavin oxidoreductase/NADH oxidase [Arthrobacter jiangjiafuii]MBP3044940.1 NADH:flavin oxidoreductase/NADH oxidase [Arthrobacter jiangjiafuii]QWC09188.1 NADH:flavin oxidoreductase/NADH oxidase [Arthrobacter jiangjiafuii]